jgi:hypothetical protein
VSHPKPRDYILSAAQNKQIFDTAIVPQLLSGGATPQASPVLVIVGSQTGAGKTALTLDIKKSLSRRGGAAHINMDFFIDRHPHCGSLRSTYPAHADACLRPDGDRWWKSAQDYVITHGLNALLESAMQTPAEFEDIVCKFDRAGYRVEAALMAVAAALSRQAILSRYAQELLRFGQGRLVDPLIHDSCCKGVLRGAKAIDRGTPRTVRVFRRGNEEVYVNHRWHKGTWKAPPPAARKAVIAGRRRALTPQQAADFEDEHDRLTRELGPGFRTELAAIKRQATPIIRQAPPRTP